MSRRATNLVAGIFDLNTSTDVFLRDLPVALSTTRLLSINTVGVPRDRRGGQLWVPGDRCRRQPRRVLPHGGERLVCGGWDPNAGPPGDVVLRDVGACHHDARQLANGCGRQPRATAAPGRPSISAERNLRIAIEDLRHEHRVAVDSNAASDVLVLDTAASTTVRRASRAPGAAGAQLTLGSGEPPGALRER